MNYKEFIDGINDENGIRLIEFYIEGYTHYNSCSIGRYVDRDFRGCEFCKEIICILTKDASERYFFWDKYDEDRKIFNFKNKGGKKSLKDIWDKVIITKIVYWNKI